MDLLTFALIAVPILFLIWFARWVTKKPKKPTGPSFSGYSSYDPRPYYSGAPVDDSRPYSYDLPSRVTPPVYDAAYYSPALDSSPSYDSGSWSSDSSSSCDSGSSSVSCD